MTGISSGTVRLFGSGFSTLAYIRARRLNLDLAVTLLIVVCVSVSLLIFHANRQGRELPVQDGSHHMAAVANIVAGTRVDGPGRLLRFAAEDTPDFLTYTIMAVPTTILGDGEVAFASVWVACLLALGYAFWSAREYPVGATRSLGIALLAFTGVFQSSLGGAWDTRIDLLSVTFASLSLLMLAGRRVFAAAIFAVAASFAKGAAVALLVPLFVLAAPLGLYSFREMLRRPLLRTAQVATLLGLSVLFAARVGPQAVSYNLMATGGTSPDERVRVFVANSATYLGGGWSFYLAELWQRYRGWIWLVPVVLLVVGIRLRWPRQDLGVGVFGLAASVYTWALMTVAPLHSNVLTIWFLPALSIVALFAARTSVRLLPRKALGLGVAALVLGALTTEPLQARMPDAAYAASVSAVFEQASALSTTLDKRFSGRPTNVVFLVNFLSEDGPLVHNYDAYRVLVQENLKRSSYTIDGWELGTFSLSWMPELQARSSDHELVFILQENPAAVPWDNAPQRAGKSVWDSFQQFKITHPDCLTSLAPPLDLPRVGRQEMLGLTEGSGCREALLQVSAAAPPASSGQVLANF